MKSSIRPRSSPSTTIFTEISKYSNYSTIFIFYIIDLLLRRNFQRDAQERTIKTRNPYPRFEEEEQNCRGNSCPLWKEELQ